LEQRISQCGEQKYLHIHGPFFELVFKLIKWAKRKHPKIKQKEHPMDNESILSKDGRTKRFGHRENTKSVLGLKTFAETPIERHNKVTGSASPFDGHFVYWVLRGRDIRPEKYHILGQTTKGTVRLV
jgi:hypothetical protein